MHYKLQLMIVFSWFAGFAVTEEQLKEVAEESGVLDVPDDFLPGDVRTKCQKIIEHQDVKPEDCRDAFVYLKEHFNQ